VRTATSTDPVVGATAGATTPDLAAIAVLDAQLARWQVIAARCAASGPERAHAPRNADIRLAGGDDGERFDYVE
jgi:methenyltetrahydromethanopterin cyclohydrolase